MSIATSTLVAFFLILPGIAFRRFYYSGEFSREYFKSSFGELLVATLVPSAIIHVFLVWALKLSPYYPTLGLLLAGGPEDVYPEKTFQLLGQDAPDIIGYFSLAILVGIVGGAGAKWVVRKLGIDREFKLFRFQNEWHYLFSGEILDFPKIPGKTSEKSLCAIDALVETGEGPVIYQGILVFYVLSKAGGINRIYLNAVRRRLMKDDKPPERPPEESPYYNLAGEFFVIPFEKIVNLHITYYAVTVEKKNPKQNSPKPNRQES